MKIAFLLPKIANQGPSIVAKDLIEFLMNKKKVIIDIYYFDEEIEIDIICNSHKKINFLEKFDFDSYDVIHSHMLRPDLYIWFHRKKSNKSVFLSTLHQNIYDNLKGNYNRLIASVFEALWLRILKSQDEIITLTQTMKDFYQPKLKMDIKTIYNGRNVNCITNFEIPETDFAEIAIIKKKYKIIGSHCLLTKRKGIHQIIQSLVYLTDFALLIIGNGPEEANLKILSIKLGVENRCVFLGYRKDALKYLDFFDIYVMASYSEGFPLGLLEAASKKLPVVCSDISIFRELFTINEVEYFSLDNPISLSTAIKRCFEKRLNYSQTILDKVQTKYSVEAMGEAYFREYEQLILNKNN